MLPRAVLAVLDQPPLRVEALDPQRGEPWLVVTGEWTAVLRRYAPQAYPPQSSMEHVEWLHQFLRSASKMTASVPAPMPVLSGNSAAVIDEAIWDAMSFLPGRPLLWEPIVHSAMCPSSRTSRPPESTASAQPTLSPPNFPNGERRDVVLWATLQANDLANCGGQWYGPRIGWVCRNSGSWSALACSHGPAQVPTSVPEEPTRLSEQAHATPSSQHLTPRTAQLDSLAYKALIAPSPANGN